MREIERMTSDVVPIKERGPRIAALTDEIERLAYVEEALVAAAIAKTPPAVVLQVRIAEATKSRAA
jgi:hypothetical protein